MKNKRQETILKIIEINNVSTQTELLEKLNAEGYDTTQATISRDIKDLRLVKKTDGSGKSYYVQDNNENEVTIKYNSVFVHSVISVDYAGNTAVIKCHQGMANAACAALDNMEMDGIVGTLAGDDTIFALCRNEEFAANLKITINNMVNQ